MKKYVMEALGTMILGLAAWLGGGMAAGITLVFLVYMGGHISGAHYNPAVTLAMLLRKKIDQATANQYWIYQLAGAVGAGLLVWYLKGDSTAGSLAYDTSATGSDMVKVLVMEIIGTFILVSVILQVAVHPKNSPNQFYGIAIGLALLGAISIYAAGSFNPALGTGGTLIGLINDAKIDDIWLCIVGPLVGGYLAAMVYGYLGEGEEA